MLYALVKNDKVLRVHDFPDDLPPVLFTEKGRWVPFYGEEPPDYDPDVFECNQTMSVLPSRVEQGWELVDRPLADVKTALVRRLKSLTEAAILAEAPDYKQRSAALGVYSTEDVARIRNVIIAHKATCDTKESEILAAHDNLSALTAFEK